MTETSPTSPAPVAAQYLATFLKPEMLHLYRQISALQAYRPVVLCQKREEEERFPFSRLEIVRKPGLHAWRRFWQKTVRRRPITMYGSEARRVEARLQALGAAVLHIPFGHMGVYCLPLLERTRVPAVVSFHGADAQVDHGNPAFARLLREVFTRARLVLARSESIAARVVEAGCPEAKVRLHRTGVPLGEIGFTPRIPPADGAWRCVQACRFIVKKGLRTTLAAFARFAEKYPAATLTLAGDGPLLPDLRQEVEERGLRDRVFFPGFVGQETLRALYRESHFFLHPSEMGKDGDQEGVPNAMLEAMASGLPAMATRHGGIPEAVEHGRSGWLVTERDAEGLAAGMLEVAGEPRRYVAMTEAAAQGVMARFDLAKQARVLEGYYDEARG